MQASEFNEVLDSEISNIRNILGSKRDEYASDRDVFHNFIRAAAICDDTPEQALAGMMKKHTISIYDMIDSEGDFPVSQWGEKITEHIVYLLLLKAMVVEKARLQTLKSAGEALLASSPPGA